MPRYTYRCSDCDYAFKAAHPIKDRLTDCPACNVAGALVRTPANFTTSRKYETKEKVGDVVRSSIEEFKEDLRREKQQLVTQGYEE